MEPDLPRPKHARAGRRRRPKDTPRESQLAARPADRASHQPINFSAFRCRLLQDRLGSGARAKKRVTARGSPLIGPG
jgi:hypothetical protein